METSWRIWLTKVTQERLARKILTTQTYGICHITLCFTPRNLTRSTLWFDKYACQCINTVPARTDRFHVWHLAMFYQVWVSPSDCNYLWFLWWSDGDLDKDPEEYQMLVHLFGGASSPSCANFALKKTAQNNKAAFDTIPVEISTSMIVWNQSPLILELELELFIWWENSMKCWPKEDFVSLSGYQIQETWSTAFPKQKEHLQLRTST